MLKCPEHGDIGTLSELLDQTLQRQMGNALKEAFKKGRMAWPADNNAVFSMIFQTALPSGVPPDFVVGSEALSGCRRQCCRHFDCGCANRASRSSNGKSASQAYLSPRRCPQARARACLGLKRQHVAYFYGKASRMHTPGPCRFFSGSGANLQVLGGDEDLSFAHASPDTSVQRRGPC
jgi:hypothetical protein